MPLTHARLARDTAACIPGAAIHGAYESVSMAAAQTAKADGDLSLSLGEDRSNLAVTPTRQASSKEALYEQTRSLHGDSVRSSSSILFALEARRPGVAACHPSSRPLCLREFVTSVASERANKAPRGASYKQGGRSATVPPAWELGINCLCPCPCCRLRKGEPSQSSCSFAASETSGGARGCASSGT